MTVQQLIESLNTMPRTAVVEVIPADDHEIIYTADVQFNGDRNTVQIIFGV